jgi:hypothetical protein
MNLMNRLALAAAAMFVTAPLAAQKPATPSVLGTWHFDLRQGDKEGPRTVTVREDSSASYGEETARWRIVGDSLWLAIGGEWEVYGLRVRGTRMTLSGGDLTDPITFDRTGPATPRPANVAVPPDPKKRAM